MSLRLFTYRNLRTGTYTHIYALSLTEAKQIAAKQLRNCAVNWADIDWLDLSRATKPVVRFSR